MQEQLQGILLEIIIDLSTSVRESIVNIHIDSPLCFQRLLIDATQTLHLIKLPVLDFITPSRRFFHFLKERWEHRFAPRQEARVQSPLWWNASQILYWSNSASKTTGTLSTPPSSQVNMAAGQDELISLASDALHNTSWTYSQNKHRQRQEWKRATLCIIITANNQQAAGLDWTLHCTLSCIQSNFRAL